MLYRVTSSRSGLFPKGWPPTSIARSTPSGITPSTTPPISTTHPESVRTANASGNRQNVAALSRTRMILLSPLSRRSMRDKLAAERESVNSRANPLGRDRKETDMTTTMARLLHTIPDALDQLGIGRSTLYELMASGAIPTVKIGSRTLIAHDELVRYVDRLKGGTQAKAS